MLTFEDSGKILTIADTLEGGAANGWLSASGTVLKSTITVEDCLKNLKKHYKTILTDYPTLRLKIITKDNKQFWCYATNEEIQLNNLIKIVDAPLDDEIPTSYEPDKLPLWRIHLSQIGDKTKIKAMASHAITDGRCIFDLFDIFGSYAIGRIK